MTHKIIGLAGRARSGKDTVATLFGRTHRTVRFAQPIKEAVKALYGWSDIAVETEIKDFVDPHWGVSPRSAMQHVAQTTRLFVANDFFVRRLFDSWEGDAIVIPDVRYKHEVDAIHARGGITIKITREGIKKHDIEFTVDELETTYQILNNGTLDDLRRQVDGLGLA
jgi:dephospho-CoA kinase